MITCPNCKKTFTAADGAAVATCPNCGAQVTIAPGTEACDYLDLELTVGANRLTLKGRIPSNHAVLDAVTRWLAAAGTGTTQQPELDAIAARNKASNAALRGDLARAEGAPV
jgi:hypothetical protein